MTESIYVGKFNYSPYASNENIIVNIPDGWVKGARVRVWSTWTKDAGGGEKSLAFGPELGAYVFESVEGDTFTIRDFHKKNYYWFTGVRFRREDSINLSLLNEKNDVVKYNISLKLHA